MDTREKDIEKLKDYKYGFTTDIENIRAPKGLNEDVIKFISNIKKEPKWMLEFRLKAFERFKLLKEPGDQYLSVRSLFFQKQSHEGSKGSPALPIHKKNFAVPKISLAGT